MEIHTEGIRHISQTIVRSHVEQLQAYATILEKATCAESYEIPESGLRAPFDTKLRTSVHDIGTRFPKVSRVLLVGIGGSDMGVRAVYEALRGYSDGPYSDSAPELIALGTIEPAVLARTIELIKKESLESFACVVISKSGTTTETIVNANILYKHLSEAFSEEEMKKRTVVITDEQSPLAQQAHTRGITVISLPSSVGGRFSIFTGVGLLPLALLGFNVDAFCDGARDAITASVARNTPQVGAVLASLLFEAYLNEVRVHELFFWNPELETMGKWYRQLLAESVGKERTDGTKVGFTPTTAIGSVDLHSLGQLIFGGRNDRFTTFVGSPKSWESTDTCTDTSPFTLPMIQGKSLAEIFSAIQHGVEDTYKQHKLPFISIELSGLHERELGAFMGLHMTMVMYLAQLFDVNAFDQPAVERYKSNVRNILHTS